MKCPYILSDILFLLILSDPLFLELVYLLVLYHKVEVVDDKGRDDLEDRIYLQFFAIHNEDL